MAQATIADGVGSVAIALSSGQVASTTLESRQLTPEEVEDAGLDPSAPENQHVVDFTVNLAFHPDPAQPPLEISYTGITTGAGVAEQQLRWRRREHRRWWRRRWRRLRLLRGRWLHVHARPSPT